MFSAPTPKLPIPVLGPPTLLKTVDTSGWCNKKSSICKDLILFSFKGVNLSNSKDNLNLPWSPVEINSFPIISCFIITPVRANKPTIIPPKINLWLSTHSNCFPYQFIKASNCFSNHNKNLLKKLVGCKSSDFPIREAIQGVNVKPTNKLVNVEVMTTTENCFNISATKTCKKRIGKNTTISTKVIDKAEKPISIRPSIAAVRLSLPISKCRCMFSNTTVASSTRIPIIKDIANNVIKLSV